MLLPNIQVEKKANCDFKVRSDTSKLSRNVFVENVDTRAMQKYEMWMARSAVIL